MKKIKDSLSKYSSLLLIIILVIAGVYFFSENKKDSNDRMTITKPQFNNFSETLGESVINCEFKAISSFSAHNDENNRETIEYGTDNQDQPVNIIFSGLNTETPVIKGNMGEDPLVIISNTETELKLASSNSFGDIFFYKIYKDQKVATWYKSYDMFGTPFASLSMGYCY